MKQKQNVTHIKLSPANFNNLMKSNDRSIAISGACMVDLSLGLLFTTVMVNDPKAVKGLLAPEQNGPLSSFAAKAKVAYALGLIDEQTKEDLYYIRKIRNEFAHSFKAISFQDSPIREYCNKLSTAKRNKDKTQRLTSIYNQAIQENIKRINKRAATELSKKKPRKKKRKTT